MNKEERLISYIYNEFGQEFGNLTVDIRNERDKYKARIDIAITYLKNCTNNGMFELRIEEYEELLKILKGGKNE